MRFLHATIFALVLAVLPSAAVMAISPDQSYPTEQQAQQHCPADVVVWVNTKSWVYHFKGQRWYGATKSGAYVCQKEADKAGDRATRNGQ